MKRDRTFPRPRDPDPAALSPRGMGRAIAGLLWGTAFAAAPSAWAEEPAKPMPTHVCSPRMGDYNDRQAFIGFSNGAVQWCWSHNQCHRLEGLPATPSPIVGFSCEREQFVWVLRADGQVYRCGGALGRKACERVPLQP